MRGKSMRDKIEELGRWPHLLVRFSSNGLGELVLDQLEGSAAWSRLRRRIEIPLGADAKESRGSHRSTALLREGIQWVVLG